MSTHLYLMGWNEILARTFDGFEAQRNPSPDWLINPATRRKLKLDILYPEIGVAVRFVGMQVTGRGRKSDWEELEDEAREDVRKELCRLNGVELILLPPNDAFPAESFKRIGMALAGASRRTAKRGRFQGKAALMERLAKARQRLDENRRRVNRMEDLAAYAESWRDREARMLADVQKPPVNGNGKRKGGRALREFTAGQWVEHEHFGRGEIIEVDPDTNDTYLTIRFVTAGDRRFMASLVADKLTAARR